MLDHLERRIETVLSELTVGWEKVRSAFEVTAALAPISSSLGMKFIAVADEARKQVLLHTPEFASAYMHAVVLTVGAYQGLIPKNLASEDDYRRLCDLIDRIPSEGHRARAWAELAMRSHAAGDPKLCKSIFTNHIQPLLQNLETEKSPERENIVAEIAPALHCAHQMIASGELAKLPDHLRDSAVGRICAFILRKRTSLEPYERTASHVYTIDFGEVTEMLELVKLATRDSLIFYFILTLSDSLMDHRNSKRFTQQQIADIAAKIDGLCSEKFPSPRYIRHNGYLICTQAQLLRLRRGKSKEWDDLAEQARRLSNTSDKVYVLCTIAAACAPKINRKQSSCFWRHGKCAMTYPRYTTA